MWECPKLHCYWTGIVCTINSTFQIATPLDSKPCLLGILDEVIPDVQVREAVSRALFQARKLLLHHWISQSPPTIEIWLANMGITLQYEHLIYQHRGSSNWFSMIWGCWLAYPGLAPLNLVLHSFCTAKKLLINFIVI